MLTSFPGLSVGGVRDSSNVAAYGDPVVAVVDNVVIWLVLFSCIPCLQAWLFASSFECPSAIVVGWIVAQALLDGSVTSVAVHREFSNVESMVVGPHTDVVTVGWIFVWRWDFRWDISSAIGNFDPSFRFESWLRAPVL